MCGLTGFLSSGGLEAGAAVIHNHIEDYKLTGEAAAKRYLEGWTEVVKLRPDAILCATHPDAFFGEGEWAGFRRVQKQARLTRWGGDCYIFALMALGFCDVIVETTFKRWDVAALIPVIEGAGGVITNWQGGSCADGGQVLAAGDRRIHEIVVKLLNE